VWGEEGRRERRRAYLRVAAAASLIAGAAASAARFATSLTCSFALLTSEGGTTYSARWCHHQVRRTGYTCLRTLLSCFHIDRSRNAPVPVLPNEKIQKNHMPTSSLDFGL
jgi:hypothetical protein